MPQARKIQGGLNMRCNHYNGVFREICEQYPDIDLPGYLCDNLQLPLDKAEMLAERIERQLQKTAVNKKPRSLSLIEKGTAEEAPAKKLNYWVDRLAPREFEYFLKWLLSDLGFEAKSEMFAATPWGIEVVATKDAQKIAIQAIRCPTTHRVTQTAIELTQETRGDCPQALVITTAYFTQAAKEAAERAGIELWDIEALNQKITQAKEKVDSEEQASFPEFQGSLLQSLHALGESKIFLIEAKADGKYDLHLPGVKYPLLTFQAQNGIVTRCVLRIKYNEPVTEEQGEVIIGYDENNQPVGPSDEEAYRLVTQYLEQFLE